MSSTVALTSRYLAEYSRRPINLVLLVVVPLVFVSLAAGVIAEFAEIVSGIGEPEALAAPTAGWAAGFLAGVAGFFHVLGSRRADRRLAMAGLGTTKVLAARLVSGGVLVVAAAGAALAALTLRTGAADLLRATAGTLMFALIYLGIGVSVGAVVRSDVNGSLLVVFVWMLDVFLGPAMAGGDVWITRLFPSHFVTLVTLDAASGHAGPVGDLGWALAWTIGSLAVAAVVFTSATRRAAEPRRRSGRVRRLGAGLRAGFRDYRRNTALWVLLVALPVFFITLSFAITPDAPTRVELTEGGATLTRMVSMIEVHGAIMVPITIGFLAGLVGLFVIQGSRQADARLALAGFRPSEILASRFGTIGIAVALTTGVSVAVTAIDFIPANWGWFVAGNVAVAATYGMIGVLAGVTFGRLGGLYVMFLLPFIDVGIAQNIMFSAAPPGWGTFLPARGAVRLLVDGAFTPTLDEIGSLLQAVGWLVGIGALAAIALATVAAPKRA